MKNTIRYMIWVAAVLVLAAGCAGKQGANKQSSDVMPTTPRQIPDTVSESFFYKIRDPYAGKILADMQLDDLTPEQGMEVLILKHLARVDSEKELKRVFDHLWQDNAPFRKLVQFPGMHRAYYRSQALTFYLLTTEPDSWKIEAADRMYSETLGKVQPGQLDGYTLHFYTYALLNRGMWKQALSFLDELRKYTTPETFYQDQRIALKLLDGRNNLQYSLRIMNDICRDWQELTEEFPVHDFDAAFRPYTSAEIAEKEKKAVQQLVQDCPGMVQVQFVQQVIRLGEVSTKEKIIFVAQDQSSQAVKILVRVQAVKAGHHLQYVDPEVKAIEQELTDSFKYSYLNLVKEVALPFNLGSEQEISLIDDYNLLIIFHSSDKNKYSIEVALKNSNKELLHTFIESIDGGVATLGGPLENGLTLLLRITTFNLTSDITLRGVTMR